MGLSKIIQEAKSTTDIKDAAKMIVESATHLDKVIKEDYKPVQ